MDNLDWSQFTPLDHLIALALIVGWLGLIGLFATLAFKLALRVYSMVSARSKPQPTEPVTDNVERHEQ